MNSHFDNNDFMYTLAVSVTPRGWDKAVEFNHV